MYSSATRLLHLPKSRSQLLLFKLWFSDIQIYTYMYIYKYTYVYKYTYTHIFKYIHIPSNIYTYTCIFKYIQINIHNIYIYIYISIMPFWLYLYLYNYFVITVVLSNIQNSATGSSMCILCCLHIEILM